MCFSTNESLTTDQANSAGADARDAVLQRVEALLPSLRERAAATEALRPLPAETEAAFHENGLFLVLQPARVGGAALCERNPRRRYFRDVHAINAHISFNFDIAGAQHGRAVLGLEEGAGLL